MDGTRKTHRLPSPGLTDGVKLVLKHLREFSAFPSNMNIWLSFSWKKIHSTILHAPLWQRSFIPPVGGCTAKGRNCTFILRPS